MITWKFRLEKGGGEEAKAQDRQVISTTRWGCAIFFEGDRGINLQTKWSTSHESAGDDRRRNMYRYRMLWDAGGDRHATRLSQEQ